MAHATQRRARTVPVPDDLKLYVADLVARRGPRAASEFLELSRHAALAVALGAPVTRGTLALVQVAKTRGRAA